MKRIKLFMALILVLFGLFIGYFITKTYTEKPNNSLAQPTLNINIQQDSSTLLFQSGFESILLSSVNEGYQYLSGKDKDTGYAWPVYILGSNFSGIHRINDDHGKAIANRLEKVEGPNGNLTTALYQEVKYDVQVTQTPYQINNIRQNPKELYIKYWIKTDTLSLKGKDEWRAIWEYKTKQYAEGQGFRMIAFMAKDIHGKPFWLFQGDRNPQEPIWQVENYDIPLIQGEWFNLEIYLKWSNSVAGYASMKINNRLIGEHHGPTTHNGQPMDFMMLTQVYGNSHPMYHWVDDIQIWEGLPK